MAGYIGTTPVPQATQHRESFTATGGQTSFATAGYTPQFIDVYLNGVKLAPADYTATNGSDVVLASGATASDILEIVAYTPFEVANQTFTGDTSVTNLAVTGTFTSRGIDDNADAVAITIDSSENVGIGTTSTAGHSNHTNLFLGGTGNIYAEKAVTADASLHISQNAHVDTDGSWEYRVTDEATNYYQYAGTHVWRYAASGTAGNDISWSEAMRIDSSGNLLVGTTTILAAESNVEGISLAAGSYGGLLSVSRDGNRAATFNRKTSDGDIVQFRKDGTTVGSIGTQNGSDFYIGSSPATIGLRFQTNEIVPVSAAGANKDAAIDVGKSNIRFKDLYLSGGVYLGGTGAANKLDDYEEGTWTPNIEGSSTSGAATFTSRSGTYTKIGRQVHVTFEWVLTNHTGSGIMDIIGLPFAPAGPTGTEYTGNIMVYQMDITVDNPISLSVYASQGASRLRIYGSRDNGTWIAQNIETANTVIGSITYFA